MERSGPTLPPPNSEGCLGEAKNTLNVFDFVKFADACKTVCCICLCWETCCRTDVLRFQTLLYVSAFRAGVNTCSVVDTKSPQ